MLVSTATQGQSCLPSELPGRSREQDAIAWASRGRPVFPVRRDKRPLTVNGLLDATTEAAAIAGWWRRWPDANVAVRTGAESKLVVLDIDGDDGADALAELEWSHCSLPATTSVRTPRGGSHYYFAHPGRPIKTTAGVVGHGIDVRGDGGYVVVPPSVGQNGRPYVWDAELPPAELPAWLVQLTNVTNATERKAEPASTWIGIVRDGCCEGQRNATLVRLVGHLLARDVDARLVAELAELANGRFRPPLPVEEVHKLVASIAGREIRKRSGGRR